MNILPFTAKPRCDLTSPAVQKAIEIYQKAQSPEECLWRLTSFELLWVSEYFRWRAYQAEDHPTRTEMLTRVMIAKSQANAKLMREQNHRIKPYYEADAKHGVQPPITPQKPL